MRYAVIGSPVAFTARFVETTLVPVGSVVRMVRSGVTGLSVGVTVYGPGTEPVVTGAVATDKGNGLYEYRLSESLVTASGYYRVVLATTGTNVDYQSVVVLVYLAKLGNKIEARYV